MKWKSENEIRHIVQTSFTKTECIEKMGYKSNGTTNRELIKMLDTYHIDYSHFDPYKKSKQRAKYQRIVKTCPVCLCEFTTKLNHRHEKTTCSHSCSNVYFNGIARNVSPTSYRTICFRHHDKQCIVCNEDKVVTVHHLDENRTNNDPSNLIPLCPTHHQYLHSRYKYDIYDKVIDYITTWKENN
jgi:hypothetical protein